MQIREIKIHKDTVDSLKDLLVQHKSVCSKGGMTPILLRIQEELEQVLERVRNIRM